MGRSLILLASLAIMLLGIWGSAVIYLDEQRLKSMVSAHLAEQTGRKLEIRGSLSVRLFPGLRIHAEDLVVSGPDGFDGPDLLEADYLEMSVRLLPLIRGSLSPGEVSIRGATLHLTTNQAGESTIDGLLSSPEHPVERGARLLSTRQLRLEDVQVVVADLTTERVDSVLIDFVELDRFAFDEPLEFRFRGDLGEPPLFSELEVQGLLLVPSTRQRSMRLANMRVTGTLVDGGHQLSLLGHLSVSSLPPLQLHLQDGRLELAGQNLDFEAAYDAGADGVLHLAARGDSLLWPLPGAVQTDREHTMLHYLRGLDTDVVVRSAQARIHGLAIEQFALGMSSRDGVVNVDALQGLAPGAVLAGEGYWDLRIDPVEGELEIELAIDDVERLLGGFGMPGVLSGSGQAVLVTQRSPLGSGNDLVATGQFEIWDGSWWTDPENLQSLEFNRLSGNFRWLRDAFDVSDIHLSGPDGEVIGWLSVALPEQAVAGLLTQVADGREIIIEGYLDRARWSSDMRPGVE